MLVRNASIIQLPGMGQLVCDTGETFPRQVQTSCMHVSTLTCILSKNVDSGLAFGQKFSYPDFLAEYVIFILKSWLMFSEQIVHSQ